MEVWLWWLAFCCAAGLILPTELSLAILQPPETFSKNMWKKLKPLLLKHSQLLLTALLTRLSSFLSGSTSLISYTLVRLQRFHTTFWNSQGLRHQSSGYSCLGLPGRKVFSVFRFFALWCLVTSPFIVSSDYSYEKLSIPKTGVNISITTDKGLSVYEAKNIKKIDIYKIIAICPGVEKLNTAWTVNTAQHCYGGTGSSECGSRFGGFTYEQLNTLSATTEYWAFEPNKAHWCFLDSAYVCVAITPAFGLSYLNVLQLKSTECTLDLVKKYGHDLALGAETVCDSASPTYALEMAGKTYFEDEALATHYATECPMHRKDNAWKIRKDLVHVRITRDDRSEVSVEWSGLPKGQSTTSTKTTAEVKVEFEQTTASVVLKIAGEAIAARTWTIRGLCQNSRKVQFLGWTIGKTATPQAVLQMDVFSCQFKAVQGDISILLDSSAQGHAVYPFSEGKVNANGIEVQLPKLDKTDYYDHDDQETNAPPPGGTLFSLPNQFMQDYLTGDLKKFLPMILMFVVMSISPFRLLSVEGILTLLIAWTYMQHSVAAQMFNSSERVYVLAENALLFSSVYEPAYKKMIFGMLFTILGYKYTKNEVWLHYSAILIQVMTCGGVSWLTFTLLTGRILLTIARKRVLWITMLVTTKLDTAKEMVKVKLNTTFSTKLKLKSTSVASILHSLTTKNKLFIKVYGPNQAKAFKNIPFGHCRNVRNMNDTVFFNGEYMVLKAKLSQLQIDDIERIYDESVKTTGRLPGFLEWLYEMPNKSPRLQDVQNRWFEELARNGHLL